MANVRTKSTAISRRTLLRGLTLAQARIVVALPPLAAMHTLLDESGAPGCQWPRSSRSAGRDRDRAALRAKMAAAPGIEGRQ